MLVPIAQVLSEGSGETVHPSSPLQLAHMEYGSRWTYQNNIRGVPLVMHVLRVIYVYAISTSISYLLQK